MQHITALFFGLLLVALQVNAQVSPQKEISPAFVEQHFKAEDYPNIKIDSSFSVQIKAALLFYPELKDRHILFRVKKATIPLTSRPRLMSIFQKPKNRRYIITISSKTMDRLEPILLKNLSFNAQVGVLGHEISHVADYNSRNTWFFIKLGASFVSKKAIDRFENNTDRRCIKHGLGYQLLAWSTEVRQKLKIEQWNGVKSEEMFKGERYMSPESILRLIDY
ncbi:MAG: hypothetical protein ACKVTZ_21235 [Bacteroidia bacterium]